MRLGDHCARYLAEVARERSDVWVLDGDLADSDGAVHFARDHQDRFVMGGIAEQSIVSMAAGMAACGLRPWVFSFASFLCYRAYDQIRLCLSQSAQPVTLVGSHAGGCAARNGKTHASLNDVTIMASLPGMRVWAPASAEDVRYAVDDILAAGQPAYMRLPRRPLDILPGTAGAIRWLGQPADVALIATGLGTQLAVEAQRLLAAMGFEVGVLHCPRLAPLEADALRAQVAECRHIVTVEDHSVFGGLGTMVGELCRPSSLTTLGWPRQWTGASGSDDDLLARYGLDPPSIRDAVLSVLSYSRP